MKPKKLLLAFLLLGVGVVLHAQQLVSGTIVDSDGESMIGVNIIEAGTTNGTITDFDGKYELTVAGPSSVLEISYTGFENMTMAVGSNAVLDITLSEDVAVLDEVVVSALGFIQKKDEIGSTSSNVKREDIARSGEVSILNALGGKASNVQISRSNGDPGAGTTIRIRGANTITGSSNPLVIVDGIPISNSTVYGGGNNVTGGRTGGVSQQSRLSDLNPNDIESVQILKGASAAALWGSRAANGVLVITTKSGKSGKVKIDYKASLSIDEVNDRLDMQTTWGQGRSGSYGATRAESWGDYIPDRSGAADELDQSGAFYEAVDGTRYYPIDERNSTQTFVEENWDQVFQNGGFQQHDLSISGGTEKATFFFSLGRLDQEGIIRNSDYDRTNLRLNNKIFLTDWLSISSKAGYTNTVSNRIQQNSNTAGLLLGLLRTPPDFDNRDYIGTYFDGNGGVFPNRQRAYRRFLGQASNPIYNNPGWTAFEQVARSNVNRFIMSSEINIIPSNWLQFKLRGGIDNSEDKRAYLFPIGSAGDRNPGIFSEDIIGEKELNFDAIGRANFVVNSDIGMTATLGWNINDRNRKINTSQLTGFLVNSFKETTALNTANENTSINNSLRKIRSNRGYAVLTADLYDQLYISASGGLEAASSVGGTFFYPAVDAAWQFTETAIPTSDVFSFGKLRASWGKVGVQPAPHRFESLAESPFSYSTYSDPLSIGQSG